MVDLPARSQSNRATANRLNAAKSTGPKTALGKQTSARNALTHGLAATRPSSHATDRSDDPLVRLQQIIQLKTELICRLGAVARDRAAEQQEFSSLLRTLTAIDRYERCARAQWLRANRSQ